MIKVRITFVDDEEGRKELKEFTELLEKNKVILDMSKVYKGRGKSIYSNVYIDVK